MNKMSKYYEENNSAVECDLRRLPNLNLNNFESGHANNCRYVLTSPKSLRACRLLKIRPNELLHKNVYDLVSELELQPEQVEQIYIDYEYQRQRKLQMCKSIREQISSLEEFKNSTGKKKLQLKNSEKNVGFYSRDPLRSHSVLDNNVVKTYSSRSNGCRFNLSSSSSLSSIIRPPSNYYHKADTIRSKSTEPKMLSKKNPQTSHVRSSLQLKSVIRKPKMIDKKCVSEKSKPKRRNSGKNPKKQTFRNNEEQSQNKNIVDTRIKEVKHFQSKKNDNKNKQPVERKTDDNNNKICEQKSINLRVNDYNNIILNSEGRWQNDKNNIMPITSTQCKNLIELSHFQRRKPIVSGVSNEDLHILEAMTMKRQQQQQCNQDLAFRAGLLWEAAKESENNKSSLLNNKNHHYDKNNVIMKNCLNNRYYKNVCASSFCPPNDVLTDVDLCSRAMRCANIIKTTEIAESMKISNCINQEKRTIIERYLEHVKSRLKHLKDNSLYNELRNQKVRRLARELEAGMEQWQDQVLLLQWQALQKAQTNALLLLENKRLRTFCENKERTLLHDQRINNVRNQEIVKLRGMKEQIVAKDEKIRQLRLKREQEVLECRAQAKNAAELREQLRRTLTPETFDQKMNKVMLESKFMRRSLTASPALLMQSHIRLG